MSADTKVATHLDVHQWDDASCVDLIERQIDLLRRSAALARSLGDIFDEAAAGRCSLPDLESDVRKYTAMLVRAAEESVRRGVAPMSDTRGRA